MTSERRFDPQMAITVEDKHKNLRGYLVIDSTIRGRAVGGLRMLPDASLEETKALARTMTLKYAWSGLGVGGAKASVVGDPEMPAAQKQQLLVQFFQALLPLLSSRGYIPRPDMGTNNKELDEAAAAVGLARRGRRYRGWGERSGLYTGFSVVGAALQALDHLKMPVATSRVAIEGFGKVGTSVAQLFSDCGARIVALSTRYGALYSAQGLNVSELMRLYQKFGSSVVKAYGQAERITIGELLELDVEVLSPCARYHSITSENASKVGASIISAGANNPVTPEAEQILFARGKLCLPDFATNCGGMLGEALEFAGFKEAYIRDFIIAKTRAKTSAMLKPLEKANGPLREHWEPIVLEKFFAVKARAERPSLRGSLYRAARTLYRHGFVPGFLVRHWARRYFDRLLVAP